MFPPRLSHQFVVYPVYASFKPANMLLFERLKFLPVSISVLVTQTLLLNFRLCTVSQQVLNTHLMASIFMRDTAPSTKVCCMGKMGLVTVPQPPTFLQHCEGARQLKIALVTLIWTSQTLPGTLKFRYVYRQLWNHISNKNHLLQENGWQASKN